ncbi:sensor histidine kinase [Leifsonia sp. LS-T14]|uniref:sensor histidine kinase n=1 Tax=unclassified Leifsonia TaxID=2663824 RepID=UPI0035A6528D
MTIAPSAPSAAPARSRARRAWALTGSITLAVLCSLLAISGAGIHGTPPSTFPAGIQTLALAGAWLMIGASVMLVWRHRWPVLVAGIAVTLTVVFPTTPLVALVACAAVVAATARWIRWLFIVGVYAATVVSFCWDVASHTSLLSDFVGEPAEGTPARLALFWAVPILAALAVAPFAGFGFLRSIRRERDAAQLDTAAATRNVAVLHREVELERERQELARELHDTLAARLSSLSLHAGALELTVDGNEQATATARIVRETAQGTLDELRHVVHVLRNPGAAGTSSGLVDIASLIDEALRDGVDVRAQVLVSDAATCHPQVAHACYRLVQESISNVRRHAPGQAIRVEVRGGPETGVTVTSTNWMTLGARPTSIGGGHGLTGMSERVGLVGGSFQAGPTADGAFAIIAWLPWTPR